MAKMGKALKKGKKLAGAKTLTAMTSLRAGSNLSGATTLRSMETMRAVKD
jgi:hypothetical protein